NAIEGPEQRRKRNRLSRGRSFQGYVETLQLDWRTLCIHAGRCRDLNSQQHRREDRDWSEKPTRADHQEYRNQSSTSSTADRFGGYKDRTPAKIRRCGFGRGGVPAQTSARPIG